MNAALVILALTCIAPSAINLEPGLQLTYEGNLIAEKGAPAVTEKKFTLSVLIAEAGPASASLYWTLREQGRGGWSWINRYGHFEAGGAAGEERPTLRYQRPEGTDVIPLLAPLLLRDEPLSAGTTWEDEKLHHEVTGSGKVGATEAWRVEVRNAYGLKRELLVSKESPLVLSLMENVFIGQGEKHELRYELSASEQLKTADTLAAVAAFDGFISLRKRLGIEAATRDVTWNEERLAALRAQLPSLIQRASSGPLTEIAKDADRDAQDQKDRAGAVALMRGRLVGKAAPTPKLYDLTNQAFDWQTTQGKVTVLHFWEYRDSPLEEPYGQIAYLDFLFRNRGSDDVQVFGVAADAQLQDPDTQRRALLGVKKLRAFMNLSYPILVDYETALEQYGDPRVTGAKLPLFVVIGKDGKVTHHHVGTYEVDRDRGLEELDKVVKQALGTDG